MTKKRTNDEFLKEVYFQVGNDYTFLDTYINNRTAIRVKHNKCGTVYETTPYRFLSKYSRCPKCRIKVLSKELSFSQDEFENKIFKTWGSEYSVLGTYQNSKTKILVKHNKCGNEFMITPYSLMNGHGCNICAQKVRDSKRKLSNKEFIKKVSALTGTEYTFLDPYGKNAHIDLRVKHNKCGTIYKVKPYNFLYNNRRCPYCNRSNGELFIKNYLIKHSIDYEAQKTFSDCKDKALLSYDFYIPKFNTLIEYQGKQHYQPIDFFGTDYFAIQKKHDDIKREYASSKGIDLLEITYHKYNQSLVSQVLTRYFKGVKQRNLNQN